MTVKELIEILQRMPQDKKVIVLHHEMYSESVTDEEADEVLDLAYGVGIYKSDYGPNW